MTAPAARPRTDLPAPFLKWAGGKTRLLGDIFERIPIGWMMCDYYEPFLGGGAVFFSMCRKGAPGRVFLGDALAPLIDTYTAVRDELPKVISELESLVALHREDPKACYYAQRKWFNTPHMLEMGPERAAVFIYLNRTCFNGLWRTNKRGEFNVPMGKYKNPTILDVEVLRAARRALTGVSLIAGDFETVVAGARRGDLVYFDPPYVPLSKTSSFTGYTAGGFTEADHERLADLVADLDARGCHVVLSNSDTPLVRKLYQNFCITEVACARSINSRGDGREQVGEVIVTTGGRP